MRQRIHFVGLQLLFLAYTAQSFVLLTANVQDIKKIASKFVSDSLADKITEFVMQATNQLNSKKADNSERKIMNTRDISDESDEPRNIARQGKERLGKKETREYYSKTNTKDERNWNKERKEKSMEKTERMPDNTYKKWHKDSEETRERTERQNKPKTTDWRDRFEKVTDKTERTTSFYERLATMTKNYWSERHDNTKNKILSDEDKYHKPNFDNSREGRADDSKREDHPNKEFLSYYNKKQSESDIHVNDLFSKTVREKTYSPPTENAAWSWKLNSKSLDKHSSESRERLASNSRFKTIKKREFDSFELNNTKSEKNDRASDDDGTTRFRGLELNMFDLTTKKEKTDFDQYDNRNYPKAVATSGSVKLIKVSTTDEDKPEKRWWEKKLDSTDEAQLKKWLKT